MNGRSHPAAGVAERPGATIAECLPRGRHGLAPEQVAESQHWRLLAAAGEVLLARGYAGVSSREISRRAGVSPATFYEHFSDGLRPRQGADAADGQTARRPGLPALLR